MILSKGHNSGIQYAVLHSGILFRERTLFNEMNKSTSLLQEHSCPSIPGIEAPTGALGMDCLQVQYGLRLQKEMAENNRFM